jgi:hypothetical protein
MVIKFRIGQSAAKLPNFQKKMEEGSETKWSWGFYMNS